METILRKSQKAKHAWRKWQPRFYKSCLSMVMKDAPPKTLSRMSKALFSNVNNMQSMIREDQKKYSYKML